MEFTESECGHAKPAFENHVYVRQKELCGGVISYDYSELFSLHYKIGCNCEWSLVYSECEYQQEKNKYTEKQTSLPNYEKIAIIYKFNTFQNCQAKVKVIDEEILAGYGILVDANTFTADSGTLDIMAATKRFQPFVGYFETFDVEFPQRIQKLYFVELGWRKEFADSVTALGLKRLPR